ncbi:MAG TPA: alpha-L-rhamnosidase C-terminal domain-containing protein [Ohtaekwangia sp.]
MKKLQPADVVFFLVMMILTVVDLKAQVINPVLLEKPWKAQWITGPGDPVNVWSGSVPLELKKYTVYKFRKTFTLEAAPASFVIHVSADNRYKLWVNGQLISLGPARGDMYYWNFETLDIARYLKPGKNVLAAVVWNDGPAKPEAQVSHMTAFIVQGNAATEEIVNTNNTWKSIHDESHQPLSVKVPGYYVAGPGERVDMNKQVKHFEREDLDDTSWRNARPLIPGIPKGVFSFTPFAWMLVPSPLPAMEMTEQRLKKVRKAEGIKVSPDFLVQRKPFTIPARTKASVLLDQEVLTNAYPTLIFSQGRGASLSMAYAEALYDKAAADTNTWYKGNRNEVEGKRFIGKYDSLISDGSNQQTFTSLWWRTYRYILLKIETKDDPLILEDVYGIFTGYPFQYKAKFSSPDPLFEKYLEVGWRTARLCAFETYMDCPYYEQLQYIGDTRIQALVTLFNSGDDRMVRNAISLSNRSRLAEGITMSRYPTANAQIIPGFSLWWIAMVHDFWRYVPDEAFVKEQLQGTREVLTFFQRYRQADGSLKNVPYWTFTDWVNGHGWKDGIAPVSKDGYSAILDIHLLWTYQLAAEMEHNLGLQEVSEMYLREAAVLKNTIQRKYWDAEKKMYADTEAKEFYSQHVNSLAILTGMIEGEQAHELAKHIILDPSLTQASIYFKYYVHQALFKSGFAQQYKSMLGAWDKNISLGLTTWAEMSDVAKSRSDCHAWGSSPNIEFFRTVLGIDSDAPGFVKVKIQPHLLGLPKVSGEMPHPAGKIAVKYELVKGKWRIEVQLPDKISGTFIWDKKVYTLNPGLNFFEI